MGARAAERFARILTVATLLVTSQPPAAHAQATNGAAPDPTAAERSKSAEVFAHPDLLAENFPTLRALVVARGDCVVFEYYREDVRPASRLPVYSVTKSVLSILVGIAIDKGLLRLDETLAEALPESVGTGVDPQVRAITIRDLLTKTEGFAESATPYSAPALATEPWRWMLERPMKYSPGAHFRYDGVGANLLSVVLTHAIKRDGEQFARENLLEPLGIRDYVWISDAKGNLLGETNLYLAARDMAKIGLLFLRDGRWDGKSIVSSACLSMEGGPRYDAWRHSLPDAASSV